MDIDIKRRFSDEDDRHHAIQEEFKAIHQKLDLIHKKLAAIEPMAYEGSIKESSLE